MDMNNGYNGIVVAIEKTVAQNLSPAFLQFLLRNEKRCFKDAFYYIFRKENEILGYAEIRYWQSALLEKPISYFINPEYQDLGIDKQMLSFVLGDYSFANLSMSVENDELDKIKMIESFGFKMKNITKIYQLQTKRLLVKTDFSSFNQISKLSKELKKQFENMLYDKIKNVSNILQSEAILGKEHEFFQKFLKDVSLQHSYVCVQEGQIQGWILFKKLGDKNLMLLDASRDCDEKTFSEFLSAVFAVLAQKDIAIKMEMIDDDYMAKMIVNLFAVKPQKVYYNYIRFAGKE